MKQQPKINTNLLEGAYLNHSHNQKSTIRDFFQTYAFSSSESGERANRLPDYLFHKSLTDPDEKLSLSRFVYSTSYADKRLKKRVLQPPRTDSQEVRVSMFDSSKTALKVSVSGRSMVDEGDSMSETEKFFLYKKLLSQKKNEDHPSLVKHRRLMFDFQTRRDIIRTDNMVLPINALYKGSIDGVHGKIVYLSKPMNRIRTTVNYAKPRPQTSIKPQNEAEAGCSLFNRPKSSPIRNTPALVTLRPKDNLMSVYCKSNAEDGMGRVYFNPRYRMMMENKQKTRPQKDSLESGIQNANYVNKSACDNFHGRNDTGTSNAVDISRRSSGTLDSIPPTPTTSPRLSLNVFLPREIEEVRHCTLPGSVDQTEYHPNEREMNSTNVKISAKITGALTSRYGLSRTSKDLLSKCNKQNSHPANKQNSHSARFQYTQARLLKDASSTNAKKGYSP